jgi:tol-pal system protein YbgF
MLTLPRGLLVLVPLLLAGCATTVAEDDPIQTKIHDLEARTARMERSVANQVEQAQHSDEVDAQLRELRGRIEELEHRAEAAVRPEKASAPAAAAGTAEGAAPAAAAAAAATAPAAAAAAAAANQPSSTEQAVYSQAYDALKAGSYSIAITGFKDFLTTYPASPLAENAQYWLGEAYYVNHDYDAAANAFRAELKKWPEGRKAPDALLKIGYAQYAQKQYPAAKATLTDVTRKYPGTDQAKMAADKLHRIPQ